MIEVDREGLVNEKKKPPIFFSVRLLIAFLIFMAAGVQYMQKIDMSIAIVCMVNNTAIKLKSHTLPTPFRALLISNNSDDNCYFKPKNETAKNDGTFVWSSEVQGFILSSYFYGYILTQVMSGWLSQKYGGRIVLGLSMLIGSLMTILASESARINYWVLIVCRFITGLAHGAVWPAMSAIFVNWAPPAEKSRLIGFSTSGSSIGNIIALPFGSYLCVHGFDGGWASIFYIFGLIGVVWFILFMSLSSDSPLNHKFIRENERDYVVTETKQSKYALKYSKSENDLNNRKNPTPWFKLFTSKPCIAIYFSHFSCNWANYLFLTQLPTYMKDILKFDIKSNGLFSALPYISSFLFIIISSNLSDMLIEKNIQSRTNVRRIFNGTGLLIQLITTVCLIFVTCEEPYLGVALLVIALGFLGVSTGGGYLVNINEVGGIYSGILFGIANTFGTLPGIIAPYIVGVLTPHKAQEEWRVVFIISSVVYFIGGVVYVLLCSGQPESWAMPEHQENHLENHQEELVE